MWICIQDYPFLDKCELIIIKCWSFYKFVLVKVTLISAPICGKTLTIKSSKVNTSYDNCYESWTLNGSGISIGRDTWRMAEAGNISQSATIIVTVMSIIRNNLKKKPDLFYTFLAVTDLTNNRR